MGGSVTQNKCPASRGISVEMGWYPRRLKLSSVKEADRQPLVYTGAGAGAGYLPTGNLPIGALPTYGAGAGGGLGRFRRPQARRLNREPEDLMPERRWRRSGLAVDPASAATTVEAVADT